MQGRKKVKKVPAPATKAMEGMTATKWRAAKKPTAAKQGKQAVDKEHVYLHQWMTMYEEHGGFWALRSIDLLESEQIVVEKWAWCETERQARTMGLERDVQRELGRKPIPFRELGVKWQYTKIWISIYMMFDGYWKLTKLSTCSSVAIETWTWMKDLR